MILPRSRRFYVWLALAALAAVLLANAHLVYVAMRSQPDCVSHLKDRADASAPDTYRAARSSC